MVFSRTLDTDKRAGQPRPAAVPSRLAQLGLVAGALLALAIGVLTLTPIPEMAEPEPLGLDKLYHLVAFAALVFPLIASDPRRWIWVAPLAVAYGGAIELIQPSVGRNAEWLDFLANSLGVAVGVWLGRLAHPWLLSRFAPSRNPAGRD